MTLNTNHSKNASTSWPLSSFFSLSMKSSSSFTLILLLLILFIVCNVIFIYHQSSSSKRNSNHLDMEIQQLTQKIEEMSLQINQLLEQQQQEHTVQSQPFDVNLQPSSPKCHERNDGGPLHPSKMDDPLPSKDHPTTTTETTLISSTPQSSGHVVVNNSTTIRLVLDSLKSKCMHDMKFHKKRSVDETQYIHYMSVGVMSSIQPRYMNLTLSMLRMGWLLNFEHKRVFVLDPIPKRHELTTNADYEPLFWKGKEFFMAEYGMTHAEIEKLVKKQQDSISNNSSMIVEQKNEHLNDHHEADLYLDEYSLDLVEKYFVNIFEHVHPNTISMKVNSAFDDWSNEWKRSQSAFIYALKYVLERFSSPWYFVVDTDSYVDTHCLGNFFQYYGQWTNFCPLALGDSRQGFMGGPGLMFNHRVKEMLQRHIKQCVDYTKKGGDWDIGLNGDHRIEKCFKHAGLNIQHAREFVQAYWTRDEKEYKSMKCVMSLHYVKTVEDQREKYEKELAKYCESHLYSYV
ncbi:hypothetical protein C9374_010650 [Naegleria lovaniensis]|uniref:Uncharacterized protein n=1 Tax=Naegleria lovaniensis TaxID=51637 RepID=A0AA88KG63_NAELO|nr:uncharacterized protein C9374_010650 [Naegleria lovaniensis]KAG2374631.1 hypothetical protein C9374_010650 [Naegleria lovaniensis]